MHPLQGIQVWGVLKFWVLCKGLWCRVSGRTGDGDLKHSSFPIRFGEYRTSDALQTIFCHTVWEVSGAARSCLHNKDVAILSECCMFLCSCHVRLLWCAILPRGRCGCLQLHLCRLAIGPRMFCTVNAGTQLTPGRVC